LSFAQVYAEMSTAVIWFVIGFKPVTRSCLKNDLKICRRQSKHPLATIDKLRPFINEFVLNQNIDVFDDGFFIEAGCFG
jgi:hypothetical protein